MMSDDDRTSEPKTLPPPKGAKDMYSAPTRIGTLPEEVLAAMRAEASDTTVAARTSIMHDAALERSKPAPAPPRAVALDIATTNEGPPDRLAPVRALVRSPLVLVAIFIALAALVALAVALR